MDKYKVCNICNIDKIDTDYVNGTDECYKCVYTRKISTQKSKNGKVKRLDCKVCKVELPSNRWTYCSQACLLIAKKQDKHWTLKCKHDTKDWKKRFVFLTRPNKPKYL